MGLALYGLGLMRVPVASFGPFLAALVVLTVTEGKSGVVGLFRRMGRWRVGGVMLPTKADVVVVG